MSTEQGSSTLTDQEAKAKLVRMALAQGATVRFFEADAGRTGCTLSWSGGHRWHAYGTTRECIDHHLRLLGCSS